MENTEIMVANQNLYISPVVGIDEAKSKFDMVRQYTAKCLTKDIDYGKVALKGELIRLPRGDDGFVRGTVKAVASPSRDG